MVQYRASRRPASAAARTSLLVLLLAAVATVQTSAAAGDLHWLWDDRCADCHGHSGDFTRRFLQVVDGRLRGRHHVDDLREFMRHHYLPAASVDAVYEMLRAQALTPPRFKQECSRCHGRASSLVRDSLVAGENGALVLRSGQSLREFMQGHRRLQAGDVDFFVALLDRVAAELGHR
jgi:hypothetical protein